MAPPFLLALLRSGEGDGEHQPTGAQGRSKAENVPYQSLHVHSPVQLSGAVGEEALAFRICNMARLVIFANAKATIELA